MSNRENHLCGKRVKRDHPDECSPETSVSARDSRVGWGRGYLEIGNTFWEPEVSD